MIRLFNLDDYRQMRWKNGAGYTTEIARFPAQSAVDFEWRISMAEVTTAGYFSDFTGKQRVISVLQGAGLTLQVDQQEAVSVKPFDLFTFDGSAQVYCDLLAGQVRDFNLIYNPKKYHVRVEWRQQSSLHQFLTSAQHVFIFNWADAIQLEIDGEIWDVGQMHSVWLHVEKPMIKPIKIHPSLQSVSMFNYCILELISSV